MGWISANNLPCEAPPTTENSGVIDFEEDGLRIDEERKHRKHVAYNPDFSTLWWWRINKGFTLQQISDVSVREFGIFMSPSCVGQYLRKYKILKRKT